MKKIICAIVGLVLIFAILASCDGTDNNTTSTTGTTAPSTTTTTTAQTTEVIKLYDFLEDRGQGDSVSLKGDVMILFVMVDDAESTWTDKDIKNFKADQSALMKELAVQAKRYGVTLNLKSDYIQCKISGTMERDNYELAVAKALSQTDYPFEFSAIKEIKEDYPADEAAVVFAFNKSGRSFAIQRTNDWVKRFEYAVIYSTDSEDALNHELMHVFGAQDLYFPKEFKAAGEKHFGSSIMINSTDAVDDLTAYLVGWTDELSDKAKAFLKDTAHITEEEVEAAHEDEMLTGTGTRYYDNGVYTGELEDGVPHGKGKMEWNDGFSYDGEWQYGKFNGYGTFTQPDGAVFEGEWKDDMMQGKGSARYASGDTYVGDFVNDKFHGKGKYTYAEGDVYEGDFYNSYFHGKGKMTYADGGYYDGEWKNDDMSGFGTMVWSNGDKYVGYWSKGDMHGQGTYTYSDGEVMKGRFYYGEFLG